jgi:hypothetical protein
MIQVVGAVALLLVVGVAMMISTMTTTSMKMMTISIAGELVPVGAVCLRLQGVGPADRL